MPLSAHPQPHRSGERQALARLQKIIFQQTITGHPDAALFDFQQGDLARAEVQHLDSLQRRQGLALPLQGEGHRRLGGQRGRRWGGGVQRVHAFTVRPGRARRYGQACRT